MRQIMEHGNMTTHTHQFSVIARGGDAIHRPHRVDCHGGVTRLLAMTCFVLSFLMLSPSSAHAACSNPAGVEGEQIYNATHKVMQFCNGTGWLSMDASSLVAGGSDDLGDHTATQNIDMATRKVINMADPTAGSDAATKSYVDSVAGSGGSDNLGNHVATSTLNMGTYKITNMAGPTIGTDAATKSYVDTNLSGKADTTALDDKVDLAGDTMTGDLTLVGAPTANEHAATKAYVDTGLNLKVDLAGATMGGPLELFGAPTANSHAATKAYVDTVLAAGGSGGGLNGRYQISCFTASGSTNYSAGCVMLDTQTGATKCRYNGSLNNASSNWDDCSGNMSFTSLDSTTVIPTSAGSESIYAANGYAWGQGSDRQLGNGSTSASNTPVAIDLNLTFSKIMGGQDHACGIASGKIYCWGTNTTNTYSMGNSIGNGSSASQPVAMTGTTIQDSVFTDISKGRVKGAARNADGQWYGWGTTEGGTARYSFGSSGANPSVARWYNTAGSQVDLPNDFTKVVFSIYHMCALRANGRLHCAIYTLDNGTHEYAAGMGNGAQRSSWLDEDQYAQGGHTFTDVAVSGNSSATTCAVANDGKIYCFGSQNSYGQLGKGDTSTGTGIPTEVDTSHITTPPTFEKVYGDYSDSSSYPSFCALTTAGKAYCWGYNGNQQLGTGDNANRNRPTPVLGDYTFTDLAMGDQHTCGLTAGGTAYCWGVGSLGRLGNGTTANKSIPEPVSGGGFVGIGIGTENTYGWK